MNMIDRYIQMRNTNKYPIQWFFDYYNDNGGKPINILEFQTIFNMGNLNQILIYIDNKFNLNSIIDSKGNLIKVFKNE